MTLNQRVVGLSPAAPTKEINELMEIVIGLSHTLVTNGGASIN